MSEGDGEGSAGASALPRVGENFAVQRGRPEVPILITCEHASPDVPGDWAELGLPPDLRDAHWGWDRWAADTMHRFAGDLGATTIQTRVSRLVLDVNRGAQDPTLILTEAEGRPLPGNVGLTPAARDERIARLHAPYHEAIDAHLGDLVRRFGAERVVFFTFHSFTGAFGAQDRDFDVGVLYDAHEDLAAGVKRALATHGLRARLNEPYSGYRGEIYAAAVHGEAHDVAYFEIELNQHVLEDPARRQGIADVFKRVVPAIFPHV